MKDIVLNITKTDLKNADERRAVTHCLLATAIRRTFKEPIKNLAVGFSFAEINGKVFNVPEEIQDLILRWTEGQDTSVLKALPAKVVLTPRVYGA